MATWEFGSLFSNLEVDPGSEKLERLGGAGPVVVERIVSAGAASPEGFWYDQEQEEWVMVVSGRARLELEGETTPVELSPGDWCRIPAHCRHRVAWTDPDQPTVWLAVHYPAEG
ncbi:MAG: cupin domain-containing protein [Acidobacteriota bacterium]